MRNIDSKSRPRTQFRVKYLAVRIRLLRLGGSLTTFSTVSVKSRHSRRKKSCPLYPQQRTFAVQLGMSAMCRFCCKSPLRAFLVSDSVAVRRFATERAMMGRLTHDQEQFFYLFR